jgi:cyclic pyranopterin monophosphate synthase
MKDVTQKETTHREATAEAMITMPPEVQSMLKARQLEKGDALEVARVGAIMAAKKTPDVIPLCHPLPLTGVDVAYTFEESGVHITVTVRTIAQTGVEMEALTAASIAALTLYDMLKPYTQDLEIVHIRLLAKKGGKSGNFDRRLQQA